MDNNTFTLERLHHITALNNALNNYHLNGYEIHEYQQQDKRKTKPLYFLTDSKGTSLTGTLDYSELNNFIRGYGKACNEYNSLLEALKNAVKFIKCCPELAKEERRPKGLEKWEALIEKAEQ